MSVTHFVTSQETGGELWGWGGGRGSCLISHLQHRTDLEAALSNSEWLEQCASGGRGMFTVQILYSPQEGFTNEVRECNPTCTAFRNQPECSGPTSRTSAPGDGSGSSEHTGVLPNASVIRADRGLEPPRSTSSEAACTESRGEVRKPETRCRCQPQSTRP